MQASLVPHNSNGPLEGVKVLEFCHFLAGPYAGLVLADLGADVLKVEDPVHPDDARSMGPYFQEGQSLYFLALNSGKRSIGVELGSDEGRAVVEDLVRGADVVIDNFRPGVLAKFGIDQQSLHALNPALVTCSLTGYGGTGPDANRAGYDYTIQARAGVMSLGGEPDGPPTKAGISYVDHSGGLSAALGVCAALVERARTGVGRHIDLGLFDIQISMLTYLASWQRNSGAEFERTANSAHPSLVPAQNFRTKDGYIALFVGNDGMWSRFVDALDDEAFSDATYATRQGRLEHREDLIDRIQQILLTASGRHWEELFGAHGVACGVVNDIAEALSEPQTSARGLLMHNEHVLYGAYEHVRGPVPTLGAESLRPAPLLGEHTTETLEALGYAPERIAALHRSGAVTG
jgi:crotonobetainyl-CoA:carnitine CoA-transferase CaiB-like acyl-CoA transferase